MLNIQDGWAEIEVKNKFSVGDSREIIHPSGNIIVKLEQIRGKNGALVESALGSGAKAAIPLDAKYANALIARLF